MVNIVTKRTEKAGLSSATVAKIGKGEQVSNKVRDEQNTLIEK